MTSDEKKYINAFIKQALKEDVGLGDVTTKALVDAKAYSRARIFCKESGIVYGVEIVQMVLKQVDPQMKITVKKADKQSIKSLDTILILNGKTQAILIAERLVLNLLSYLSAIATKTNQFVRAVKPHKVAILDTRKTTPTLRVLERMAVRAGGGINHRFNLNDMVMIKDNHRLHCFKRETLVQTVSRVRRRTRKKIEVEVDSLQELKNVLPARPDIILLDNMSPRLLRKAVGLVKKEKGKRPLLEASGGITLKNVKSIAATGVDRISVGALTHSRQALDFSLELIK